MIAGRPKARDLDDADGMKRGLLREMHLFLPLGDVNLDLQQ